MVHECIESYNNGKPWKRTWRRLADEFYKSTFREELEVLGDIPELTKALLQNYVYYYEDHDEDYEVLENELHFILPLCIVDGIIVNIEGYIDSMVKKPDGKIFIRDYKTFSRIPEYSNLQFNFQSAIYIWAAQELGYDIQGMEWDIIKPVMPTGPAILKNGKMSIANKSTITPFEAYKVIEENGLDEDDYEDFLNGLSFDNFFRRIFIRNNHSQVDAMMEDVRSSAEQMIRYGEEFKDMNLDTKFKSQYLDLWRAELSGSDLSLIIKQKYETKDERDGKEEKTKGKAKRYRVKN